MKNIFIISFLFLLFFNSCGSQQIQNEECSDEFNHDGAMIDFDVTLFNTSNSEVVLDRLKTDCDMYRSKYEENYVCSGAMYKASDIYDVCLKLD